MIRQLRNSLSSIVGWPIILIHHLYILTTPIIQNATIFAVHSSSRAIISATGFDPDTFRHPTLTSDELHEGCKLGIDTWADTSYAGKHAYVEEFIIGKYVTASGFTAELGQIESLPMANVFYAYDNKDG